MLLIIISCWGRYPIKAMINIISWNVRVLNNINKQKEVANTLSINNVGMFGLLETKIKRQRLGPFYRRVCYGWYVTSNLSWHKGGRIIVGWKQDYFTVDVRFCSSQLIHLFVILTIGDPFFCSFIYGANDKNMRLQLFSQLDMLSNDINKAWVMLGDFNCLANLDE